jgi:glycosyltransferase involved in cell wall biosynthesis
VIVVFLTHNYPRYAGDLPGSFLHPLALALRERGHDVRVVAPADQGKAGRELLEGIPVRRVRYAEAEAETLAYTGKMQQAIRSPAGWLALRGLIRAMRAGARAEIAETSPAILPSGRPAALVHAHWWFPAGVAAPPEVPRVITLHGTDGRVLKRNSLTRAMGRRVLRRANLVTTVSSELAWLVERVSGRRDVEMHVQPMPVDTTGWTWSEGGGGLIVVGRLTEQKRIHLAIRAAQLHGERGGPLPLTIIGDGPERARLEAEAAGRQVQARFLGSLGRAEVIRELSRADAMLFTAREEGFGLAAIEALMAGVPVVACQDGGGLVSALRRHGGGVIGDCDRDLQNEIRTALLPETRVMARRAGTLWRGELAPSRVAVRFAGWYEDALA